MTECDKDPSVCYSRAAREGETNLVCTSLTAYKPTLQTGYFYAYPTSEDTINGTVFFKSIVLMPTPDSPIATATYLISGGFTIFRSYVGLGDHCFACDDNATCDGVNMAEYVWNGTAKPVEIMPSSANAKCQHDPTWISVDISKAQYLRLQVNGLGNTNCDIALYGDPELCYSSGANTTCKTECEYRWTTETLCQLDKECLWDDNEQKCRTTCSEKDIEECLADSDICDYDQFQTPSCRKKCSLLIKDACLTDNYCSWDGGACYKKCWQRIGLEECLDSTHCEWDGPREQPDIWISRSCDTKCSLRKGSAECLDQDPYNMRCTWNPATFECRQRCELNSAGPESCNSDPYCEFISSAGLCVTKCQYKYVNSSKCDADLKCMWDPMSQMCKKGCDYI